MRIMHVLLVMFVLFTMGVSTASAQTPSLVGALNATVDREALRVVYDHQLDKSVAIVLYGSQYGTGWFIAPHYDIVVTAAHVVNYKKGVVVKVYHGGFEAKGVVIGVDAEWDIAVIRLDKEWLQAKPLPLCTSPLKGAEVVVVGYPIELLYLNPSLRTISGNPRAATGIIAWIGDGLVEITATVDAGNSGGPVIDIDAGCVYGLISFALQGEVSTTYYATTSTKIMRLLDKLGISYETRAPGTSMSSKMDSSVSSNKSLTYIAVAGLGVLLLGVLLFGDRRKLALLLLPLLAAALMPMQTAEAKVVKVGLYAIDVPDNVHIVACSVGKGYAIVRFHYCLVCMASAGSPDCLHGGDLCWMVDSPKWRIWVFAMPLEHREQQIYYYVLQDKDPGYYAKDLFEALTYGYDTQYWKYAKAKGVVNETALSLYIKPDLGRHTIVAAAGLDYGNTWLICVGLANMDEDKKIETMYPAGHLPFNINNDTKVAAIAVGLGALAGLALLALTRR